MKRLVFVVLLFMSFFVLSCTTFNPDLLVGEWVCVNVIEMITFYSNRTFLLEGLSYIYGEYAYTGAWEVTGTTLFLYYDNGIIAEYEVELEEENKLIIKVGNVSFTYYRL